MWNTMFNHSLSNQLCFHAHSAPLESQENHPKSSQFVPGSKLTDLTDSKCLGYDGDMGMNGGYYTGDHNFMVQEFYNII
jgi:hypothetical protein